MNEIFVLSRNILKIQPSHVQKRYRFSKILFLGKIRRPPLFWPWKAVFNFKEKIKIFAKKKLKLEKMAQCNETIRKTGVLFLNVNTFISIDIPLLQILFLPFLLPRQFYYCSIKFSKKYKQIF